MQSVAREMPSSLQLHLMLRRVGRALDNDEPIRVFRDGVVIAEEAIQPDLQEGKRPNESERTRGSAAGSRKRPARRGRPPHRPRPSGPATRLSVGGLRRAYRSHVADLQLAYDRVKTWPDEIGMWLAVESSLLSDLDFAATFLIGIPYVPMAQPRSWGFWKYRKGIEWIGPRHTNFPDGSVCAFAPDDGVWVEGGSLTSLVDFYSVWAVRHLFLAEFGRWPGRQQAPGPFYRLIEFREGELCSCGSGERYYQCCRLRDQAIDLLTSKREFNAWSGGHELGDRHPPSSITDFMTGIVGQPPSLSSVHPDCNSNCRNS